MRRAILAVLGTATGTALLVGFKANAHAPAGALAAHAPGGAPAAADPGGAPAPSAPPGPSAGTSGAAAASGAAGTPGAAGTTTAPPRGGGLHDGSFTGSVVSTRYGPVQVRVTVSGGRMTDVVALQLPTAELRSVRINERAVPILRQEALTAQSASIDTVSGATYTSNGYRGSLQSALDAARRG